VARKKPGKERWSSKTLFNQWKNTREGMKEHAAECAKQREESKRWYLALTSTGKKLGMRRRGDD
jgi:hypothetical protein